MVDFHELASNMTLDVPFTGCLSCCLGKSFSAWEGELCPQGDIYPKEIQGA